MSNKWKENSGIGAGGSRKNKGLNPYKHDAAAKRKTRLDLPQQDDLPQPPPLRITYSFNLMCSSFY